MFSLLPGMCVWDHHVLSVTLLCHLCETENLFSALWASTHSLAPLAFNVPLVAVAGWVRWLN